MDPMLMSMQQLPESPAPHTVASFRSPQFSITTTTHNNTTPVATSINNPPSSSMPCSSFTHFPSTTILFPNNNRITPTLMLQEHHQTPEATLLNSEKRNSMAAMREMIFRIAAMQPIHTDSESVKPPKRRNVRISKDPQSVAARLRRERISERIRTLQRLVPGGTKMDTASMLDEAIHYLKFLKSQVQSLQRVAAANSRIIGFPYLPLPKPYPACQIQSTNTSYDW